MVLFTIKPPVITMSIMQPEKKKSYFWALHPQVHVDKWTYANRLDCFWAAWPCLCPFLSPGKTEPVSASGYGTSSRHQPMTWAASHVSRGALNLEIPLGAAPAYSPCLALSHCGTTVSVWMGAMVSLDREAAALPGSCMVWHGAGVTSQHPEEGRSWVVHDRPIPQGKWANFGQLPMGEVRCDLSCINHQLLPSARQSQAVYTASSVVQLLNTSWSDSWVITCLSLLKIMKQV